MCKINWCDNEQRGPGGFCNRHRIQIQRLGRIKRTKFDKNTINIRSEIAIMVLCDAHGKAIAKTIFDKKDIEKVKKHKWYFSKTNGYPSTRIGDKIISLSIFLCGTNYDHKNRNKLDNRRSNLRKCTKATNALNSEKRAGNYTSKFKGVCWCKRKKRWRATITVNKKQIYLCVFEKEEDAAFAYNKAAQKHYGEFAVLNKV